MKVLDFIGVGAGPSGLSLAALAETKKQFDCKIFDKVDCFSWHKGMLLPQSKLQTSYLKDLVTPVDPTNPYSFLNYLKDMGHIYQFITANFPRVSRREFNNYLSWAFKKISTVQANTDVQLIEYKNKFLYVNTSKGIFKTKNIVLSVGSEAYVPIFCRKFLSKKVFHSKDYNSKKINFSGKRIVVVGGGQSGAEIVDDLLGNQENIKSISWISSRSNFIPMDDSPFVNEIFTPKYSQCFYSLPFSKKQELLVSQKFASVGISEELLNRIYKKLYFARFVDKKNIVINLLPECKLITLNSNEDKYLLSIKNNLKNREEIIEADYVILCTGYRRRIPGFIKALAENFRMDNGCYAFNKSYQIVWPHMNICSIYVQNFSQAIYGISDPNLSLLAYRAATIINSIAGEAIYKNIIGETVLT